MYSGDNDDNDYLLHVLFIGKINTLIMTNIAKELLINCVVLGGFCKELIKLLVQRQKQYTQKSSAEALIGFSFFFQFCPEDISAGPLNICSKASNTGGVETDNSQSPKVVSHRDVS